MKCYIQRERVKGSLKRRCAARAAAVLGGNKGSAWHVASCPPHRSYLLFLGAGDGYQRGKLLLCAARSPVRAPRRRRGGARR
jgi:hypothetical protein